MPIVISWLPSKATPFIFLAVFNLVALELLPVIEPLTVRLPVIVPPANGKYLVNSVLSAFKFIFPFFHTWNEVVEK